MSYGYSLKLIQLNKKADPKRLGIRLGKMCIKRNVPVAEVATKLGVSRQTVYNWFEGKDIFVAYQNRVELLLTIMQSSRTADEAWRRICQEYNLEP